MTLTGSQFQELKGLILDAFSPDGLNQLVHFQLGSRMYEELVATGLPFDTAVYNLLTALEQRGWLVKFLRAVLVARPDKHELQDKIPKIVPEILNEAISPAVVITSVADAVTSASERGKNDPITLLMKRSGGTLETISSEISLLGTYKTLHDSLHTLQVQILGRLSVSARKMKDDPDSMDDFATCRVGMVNAVTTIKTTIGNLPAAPASLRLLEEDWVERLRIAAEIAREASNNSSIQLGRQSAQLLRRILRQEPVRIDRYLRITAEAIDLTSLSGIFTEAVALSQGTADEIQFLNGANATQQLSITLRALINQHTSWQDIENQLWEADDYIPKASTTDPGDFDAFWNSLKKKILILVATEPQSDWSLNLNSACDAIDALRHADDWKRLGNIYKGMRDEAIMQFFRIDSSLKKLADDIRRIGDSLENLLRTLQV